MCALRRLGLYHRWRWNPRWRPILRRIDHSTIFVFIAACYTPVALLILDGSFRWVVLGLAWGGAAPASSSAWRGSPPHASWRGHYVALGWVALMCLPQLRRRYRSTPLC